MLKLRFLKYTQIFARYIQFLHYRFNQVSLRLQTNVKYFHFCVICCRCRQRAEIIFFLLFRYNERNRRHKYITISKDVRHWQWPHSCYLTIHTENDISMNSKTSVKLTFIYCSGMRKQLKKNYFWKCLPRNRSSYFFDLYVCSMCFVLYTTPVH